MRYIFDWKDFECENTTFALKTIEFVNSGLIFNYFPTLSEKQREQFRALESLYQDWNLKINVVSRKDIDQLYLRHVLHSLGIAKIITFKAGTTVLDVGTGGGFPAIPLAILFPEVEFTAIDPIRKKIKVVDEVISQLGLLNIQAVQTRAENMKTQFDFVVSRAVAAMPTFVNWTAARIAPGGFNEMPNGILYLKGGDLREELKEYPEAVIYPLKAYFTEDFFETKVVVYWPVPTG